MVKTASPEMLAFAPKALPRNTGPSYLRRLACKICHESNWRLGGTYANGKCGRERVDGGCGACALCGHLSARAASSRGLVRDESDLRTHEFGSTRRGHTRAGRFGKLDCQSGEHDCHGESAMGCVEAGIWLKDVSAKKGVGEEKLESLELLYARLLV